MPVDQSEAFFDCPYCGERISILVDHSVESQDYIEDCEVCCQPISLNLEIESEQAHVHAERGDG